MLIVVDILQHFMFFVFFYIFRFSKFQKYSVPKQNKIHMIKNKKQKLNSSTCQNKTYTKITQFQNTTNIF